MRSLCVALFAIGCGKPAHKDDAPPPPPPDEPPADAPPFGLCANPVHGTKVTMRQIGKVDDVATLVTSPPRDLRKFVLERGGAIRIFDEHDQLLPAPFIDLSSTSGGPVRAGDELGLLGLAFHPAYAQNRTFYVFYTARAIPGDPKNQFRDTLARCTASATDPNTADRATCVDVLTIPDPFTNHNGGMIEFGPDGLLYIGTGDGGSGGDPNNNAQALVTAIDNTNPDPRVNNVIALLGKILRIDVDHEANGKKYAIPADNPYATGGGEPEIFAIGLRNPWRWSFDRATGDMWIGDVGQGSFEEIDVVKAGELKGKNFGWSMYEGNTCFKPPCDPTGKTFPQDEKTHRAPPNGDGWAAVIGGQVYRGTCYPDLVGTYFYTDNLEHGLHTGVLAADGSLAKATVDGTFPMGPSSIHEDARGELYETDVSGNVYHLEVAP